MKGFASYTACFLILIVKQYYYSLHSSVQEMVKKWAKLLVKVQYDFYRLNKLNKCML